MKKTAWNFLLTLPMSVFLLVLAYRFPIGEKTQFNIFAQSDGANEIGLSSPTNPFEGSASNGISRFSRRNMVFNYGDVGPGIAILHNLSDQWQLGASYSAPNGDNPSLNNGLFTGRYVAFGQITYLSPNKNFRMGLSYANTYSPAGTLGQGGTNFGSADSLVISSILFGCSKPESTTKEQLSSSNTTKAISNDNATKKVVRIVRSKQLTVLAVLEKKGIIEKRL